MLTEAEAAWLACAVDSEGTITVSSASRRKGTQRVIIPLVMVANTNTFFLDRADALFKKCGAKTFYTTTGQGRDNVKECYRVETRTQRSCNLVLREIFHHLIIKQDRAEAIIRWIEARKEARKSRPASGGGSPYNDETEQLFTALGRKWRVEP